MNMFTFLVMAAANATTVPKTSIFGFEVDNKLPSREAFHQHLITFFDHLSKGDCAELQGHTKTVTKKYVTDATDMIEQVGNVLAKDNPMLLPLMAMAKGYGLSMGHSMIDSTVEGNLCSYVANMTPEIKTEVVDRLKDAVKSLKSKEDCHKLQATFRKARESFHKLALSSANNFIGQFMDSNNLEQYKAFIPMGTQFLSSHMERQTEDFIEKSLCPFAYGEEDKQEL